MVLLACTALLSMYITYGAVEFFIVVGFTAVMVLAVAAFAAVIAGHNRFRMWARYDSPLGLERSARRKQPHQQQYQPHKTR